MKKKFLVGLISVAAVGALSAAQASAEVYPQLWTDSTKTTPLRGVKITCTKSEKEKEESRCKSSNQPDSLEFVNNGNVEFKSGTEAKPEGPSIICSEVELGTTVLANNGKAALLLALPWGVAEGDDCNLAEPPMPVPVYFDTLPTGNVGYNPLCGAAKISVTNGIFGSGPVYYTAEIKCLKLSLKIAGNFCTANLNGIKGTWENWAGILTEESPQNLNVGFANEVFPITGAGCPAFGTLNANFFLETPSTVTDTAFVA